MKVQRKRIQNWRKYKNSYNSEELAEIRKKGGRIAVKEFLNYVPPRIAYEKWIYKNESGCFSSKPESGKSFLIVMYSMHSIDITKYARQLKREGYCKFRIVAVNNLSEVFNPKIREGEEDYILFINSDSQELAINALGRLAQYLKTCPGDFIYSDQDIMAKEAKRRLKPFFKPDWSPDTFRSFFYTGNLAAYKRTCCNGIDVRKGDNFNILQYYFTKEIIEQNVKVVHIPEILCHEKRPYVYCSDNKIEFNEEDTEYFKTLVNVNIIIPSKDNLQVLKRGIDSIQQFEWNYLKWGLNYEIIVVDNGSSVDNRIKIEQLAQQYGFLYIYEPMPFNFSRMCNLGAQAASGEYLLFLNDDIEAREPGWIMKMYELASREHVGAVGAKLYYPESRKIQHIGVVNLDIGPGHYFLEQEDEGDLYFGRNIYDYNCLAVTAACMMIDRKKFEQVGGFDESFPVSYNDIDLCFSLYEQGYYNVVCNRTSLYHHESFSRGYDNENKEKEQRLLKERQRLYEKHPGLRQKDPFYNKNLSGWLGNFELNLDEYGKDEKDILPLPDSKVERLWWDIRPEWLNPDLVLQIDYINQEQGHVSIRGWAYLKDRDNFRYIRRLVFLNEEDKSFCVGTRSRYRGYLKEQFPEIEGMEMLGFTCDFSPDKMKGKNYRIGMMAESKDGKEIYMIFTDRILEL